MRPVACVLYEIIGSVRENLNVISNFFRKKGESKVTDNLNDNNADVVDLATDNEMNEEAGPAGQTGAGASATAEEKSSQGATPSSREADLSNKLVRLQADFDNFRKRSLAARAEAREETRREIVLQLLPVYDNFNRAMDHAEEVEDYGSLRTGIEGIMQQMREFFNRQNVHEIPATPGTAFDPNLHDAVGTVQGDAQNHHTIAQEVLKGFELNGSVIRPASVLVYSGE